MTRTAVVSLVLVAVVIACAWRSTSTSVTGETKDGGPYLLDDFFGEGSQGLNGRTFLIEVQFVERVGDADDGTIICAPLPGSNRKDPVRFDVPYDDFGPFYDLGPGERIVVQARYPGKYADFDECVFVRKAGRTGSIRE